MFPNERKDFHKFCPLIIFAVFFSLILARVPLRCVEFFFYRIFLGSYITTLRLFFISLILSTFLLFFLRLYKY